MSVGIFGVLKSFFVYVFYSRVLFTLFTLLAYLNYTPRTPSQNWTPDSL